MELDIGDGIMNKEQAKKEYDKIIREANEKTISIMEEAKKNGTWKQGLDSNKELFAKHNEETKNKIKSLISMID